ncbi:phosphoribosyl-AMP cyclohydrolase [Jiella sp. MQZ9-1]|uniref:Phosphoribosyl-AMP cyclohydrolase n=1 Tax=Jiella flava TaxID=2816857 RepID=A0A939G0M7_9HYPH|nr:phosphoribosyl-AMP cyclohydrolase [Jiella flava]MBO0663403.1 phosphoribosyl-AMP cyclohydrolase [Jiella flava]MCD2471979.1 phosphoribosyl-AMP cyclohydrolase [Jiella flava]
METTFPLPSSDTVEQEEGTTLRPRFDINGLITAVTTDHQSGEVLMVAHMNAEALERTMATGIAHYWSRSRKTLWKKGESSGALQIVRQIRIDCDQDAVWLKVVCERKEDTCHTGRESCFYRAISPDDGRLKILVAPPSAD